MAVLLVVCKPDTLVSYDDNDIIQALDAEQSPGTVVEQNAPARFEFCYITDREVIDSEIMNLMVPLEEEDPLDPSGLPIMVEKRRYGVNLSYDPAFLTYAPYATAPEDIKFTWAEFEPKIIDKAPE